MKNVAVVPAILILLTILTGFIGWVQNIIKIFGLFGGDLTAELVVRLVGVPVAVIGAVAGYF